MNELTETVRELAQAQQRTEACLEALAEAQQRTETRLEVLTETVRGLIITVDGLKNTVGDLKGRSLEQTYRDRAGAYFGRFLRGVKAVEPITLETTFESTLNLDEFTDLLFLDLLVTGKVRQAADTPEVWLAVEISSVIDRNDVERALRRASLMRRAGYRALPVVAGESTTRGAETAAQEQHVTVVVDGQVTF